MIFGNKKEVCQWHKCEIGYKYHHTGEEWDTHVGYAKIDIPSIDEPTSSVREEYMNGGALPTTTTTVQSSIQITDDTLRKFAIVTLFTIWGVVLFLAARALT